SLIMPSAVVEFFFFSSRRRHTRFSRDWSSDVCSSDLLRMQGMLLRVLETGEVQKVGADRVTTRVDVRVIGATHRDLAALVANGKIGRASCRERVQIAGLVVGVQNKERTGHDARGLAKQ